MMRQRDGMESIYDGDTNRLIVGGAALGNAQYRQPTAAWGIGRKAVWQRSSRGYGSVLIVAWARHLRHVPPLVTRR